MYRFKINYLLLPLERSGKGGGRGNRKESFANARRDVAIYRELAQTMMSRAASVMPRDKVLEDITEKFSLEGFFVVDSSTVPLTWSAIRGVRRREASEG